jgi:leucyl aminopeptidase
MAITFTTARTVPRRATAVGVPVATSGAVPRSIGLSRAVLTKAGFDSKVGQHHLVTRADGTTVVALGVGEPEKLTDAVLRKAAATFARAAAKHTTLALTLTDVGRVDGRRVGQAVAEGIVLGSYRFSTYKRDKTPSAVAEVVLVAEDRRHRSLAGGADKGAAIAGAVTFARDLANTPPVDLPARVLAEKAVELASRVGLDIEVWDEHRLADERCGGLLAVNRGSLEPPRLVKLTYSPRNASGTVALVGKGVMFDSGGLSLKTNDGMLTMKLDMSGAAAVLAAMSVLPAVRPNVKVIGYLCCTDNMPGADAQKVSDTITYRDGTTVEVMNTDAEGRLVLADALILAAEAGVDAIVDIATLTGACVGALGKSIAGVMGNHDGWTAQVRAAADAADEGVWPLPLPPEYRKLLDSEIADLKNVGGPFGGALTAGLFLKEFVGDTPWAHLDIAGPMRSEADDGWLSKGATAFGVRTFVELLERYAAPIPARS